MSEMAPGGTEPRGIPCSLGAGRLCPVTNASPRRDVVAQGKCPRSPHACPSSAGRHLVDARVRDKQYTLMLLINMHSREMNITRAQRHAFTQKL